MVIFAAELNRNSMTYGGDDFRNLQLQIVRMRIAFRDCVLRTLQRNGVRIAYEVLQILSTLSREEGIPQQILARRTGKGKACLSSLLNHMQQDGYIDRRPDPADRRNKLVYLTPDGRDFWNRLRPLLDEAYARAEAQLGVEEIRRLSAGLSEVHDVLEQI